MSGMDFAARGLALSAGSATNRSTLGKSALLPSAIPGVYNLKYSNNAKIISALHKVRAGSGRARIYCAPGDSTTLGIGTPLRTSAWPALVAQRLIAGGLAANINNVTNIGNISDPAAYSTYNPTITFGAGWIKSPSASVSIGGHQFRNNSTTNNIVWTPPSPVDTFVVPTPRNSGLGLISVNIDGGAATQIDQNGANGLATTTFSVAKGVHTLNVSRVSGDCYVGRFEAFDSTTPAVDIFNAGWSGSTDADWVITTYNFSPLGAGNLFVSDLSIINLGINIATTPTPDYVRFEANMRTLIEQRLAVGNVWLMVPIPSSTASIAGDKQAEIARIIYKLAVIYDLTLLDFTERFVSYSISNTNGLYFDDRHATAAGYSSVAGLIANVLLQF